MDIRHVIAYGLIVLLVGTGVGLFFYLRYHSRERMLRRQRLRDDAWRKERLEAAAGGQSRSSRESAS